MSETGGGAHECVDDTFPLLLAFDFKKSCEQIVSFAPLLIKTN